jgi:hypothetical protein
VAQHFAEKIKQQLVVVDDQDEALGAGGYIHGFGRLGMLLTPHYKAEHGGFRKGFMRLYNAVFPQRRGMNWPGAMA